MKPEEVLDDLDVAGDLLALAVPVVLDLDPALLVVAVGLLGRLALAGLDLLHGVLGRGRGPGRERLLLPRDPDILADEHVAPVLLAVHVVLAPAHVDYQEQGCVGVTGCVSLIVVLWLLFLSFWDMAWLRRQVRVMG